MDSAIHFAKKLLKTQIEMDKISYKAWKAWKKNKTNISKRDSEKIKKLFEQQLDILGLTEEEKLYIHEEIEKKIKEQIL